MTLSPHDTSTKSDLRARVLALRQTLGMVPSPDGETMRCERAGETLRDFALSALKDARHPSLSSAERVVAGYWPMRGEIDCLPLLRSLASLGWGTALPVVPGAAQPLSFRRWSVGDALEDGPFRTRHPAKADDVVPDCLLVPLVAFDRRGLRLGYGGGFYDRTLSLLRAGRSVLTLGLAYAGQEVEQVPADPHDEPLDWVITEREAIGPFPPMRGGGADVQGESAGGDATERRGQNR